MLETYRECLQDVFDLPALKGILHGLQTRELDLVEVETASASPFASSLLFDYIATYMYEDDTPPAERRAQALSLDRDLLRELLGQEELRELIDPDALADVERQLRGDPRDPDELHDVLRRRGDLRAGEYDEGQAAILLAERARSRRSLRGRGAPDRRRGLRPLPRRARRDAARRSSRGLPRGRPRLAPPARAPLREGPRSVHDGRGRAAVRARSSRPCCTSSSGPTCSCAASSGRAAASASGATPRCCAACAEPRSPRCGARSSRPSRPRSAASCRRWHGIGRRATLREALVPLQGLALPVTLWESEVLPRRVPGYQPAWLDGLCAAGELVWVGAGLDRVAVYFREDAPLLGRPAGAPPPETPEAAAIREALARSAMFWGDLLAETGLEAESALPALWELVWAGEVTNDAWTPLRAGRRYETPSKRASASARGASPARAAPSITSTQGRWSPTERLFGGAPDRRALAELLLERQGIVTRDGVRGEGIPGGYGAVYSELKDLETIGACRRGYFVEGLGGAQFALPGAVERLRELRAVRGDDPEPLVLAAADPAQPYGAALPWPKRAGARAARVAGAQVVLLGGEAALFVERGGRTLVPLREPDEEWLRPAVAALVEYVRAGGAKTARRRAFRRPSGHRDGDHAAARRGGLPRRPRRAVLRP